MQEFLWIGIPAPIHQLVSSNIPDLKNPREEVLKSSSMRIILLSHGDMATTLVRTVEKILARDSCVEPWDLDWNADKEAIRTMIGGLRNGQNMDEEILILTDMPGNTPTNVALEYRDPGRLEVVCGANLPMLLRLSCRPRCERSLSELAEWIAEKGRCAIVNLENRDSRPCEDKK